MAACYGDAVRGDRASDVAVAHPQGLLQQPLDLASAGSRRIRRWSRSSPSFEEGGRKSASFARGSPYRLRRSADRRGSKSAVVSVCKQSSGRRA